MILLDTSVLSLAFRRRGQHGGASPAAGALRRLIEGDAPLAVPGIVLQELLSGVRGEGRFSRLRRLIEPFPVLLAERRHHIEAARIANTCWRAGVSASTVDCLIAALAIESEAYLFTLDADFVRIARCSALKLWEPSPSM